MDDINSTSGAPQGSSGADQGSNQDQQASKPDGVSYDTYRKVLDEAKKARERLSALEAESRERERKTLEETGKFQELYAALKTEHDQLKERNRAERNAFAYKTLSDQFKAEAAKAGCQKLDVLEKLVDLQDLATEVDDSLNVRPEALRSLIEKSQKEYDFLFAKKAPSFRDAPPSSGAPEGSLTYEAWLKLPVAEQKKRIGEVMATEAKK